MPHNAEGLGADGRPDLKCVAGQKIYSDIIAKEKGQLSGWWERKRAADDAQFLYGVGAVPEKPKVTYAKPPEQVIGKAAREHMNATPEQMAYWSTMKEDYYFSQCSELWDYLREKRHYKAPGDTSAAWHGDPTGMTCTFSRENFKKGIPKHYGATLHGVSSDGTDPMPERTR